MARKVFIAATGQNSGKTTTSLSLVHLARKVYDRVGFIKPLGPKPVAYGDLVVDKDAAVLAEVFGLQEDIGWMSPLVLHPGMTKKVLDGEISRQELEERIVEAGRILDEKYDFLVIEGSGHSGVGAVIGLSNARIAQLLDAPVMIICGGGVGNAIDAVSLNLAMFRQQGVAVKLVMANKIIPEKRLATLHYLGQAFAGAEFPIFGGFNYSPILANPTLGRIAKILDRPLRGESGDGTRIIHHVQLATASSQRVIDLLDDSSLLLVNSTRDELLVTLSSLYHLPEYYALIAGLVIPGLQPVSKITQKILEDSKVPYIRTEITNAAAFTIIKDDVSKITAEDTEKIELIERLAESELDFAAIDALL